MKKSCAILVLFSLLLAIFSPAFAEEPAENMLAGDVNGDGVVDGRDTIRLLKLLNNEDVEVNLYASDVTGDATAGIEDVEALMNAAADKPGTVLEKPVKREIKISYLVKLDPETGKLTIVTWDATTTMYMQPQKEAFEASHPGITIEYVDVPSQDYAMATEKMLKSGDQSDLYMVKTVDDLVNWQEQGFAASLDEFIAKSGYDLTAFKGTERPYHLDGKQYALPFRSDCWLLYYNKDLFDAAGVAYPTNDWTWADYEEAARKLTDPEKEIAGTHYHTWMSDVINWAVCDGVNTLADGNYDDLLPYYKLYQRLEDAGAFLPFAEQKAAGIHYSSIFASGHIAMMPMGSWFTPTLIQYNHDGTCNFNWGVAAVPHAEDIPAGSTFGNVTGAMINAKSPNQKLAWEYLSWLSGEGGAKATASVGVRPAYVSDSVTSVLASVDGYPTDASSKAALAPSFVAMEQTASKKSKEIMNILNDVHIQIMTRQITPEEGIRQMNERVQEILK